MKRVLCDSHTHTHHSHDAKFSVEEMARAAAEKGVSILSVTDHCDIEYYKERDILNRIKASVAEAATYHGPIRVLRGVEIGEGIWNLNYTNEVLKLKDYDVIIGSIHAARHPQLGNPYSEIDFTNVPDSVLKEYMQVYFEDMLEMLKTVPCDVLAHITCPLRYIEGKYGRCIDLRPYQPIITAILQYIISHGIAMEINTSATPPMPGEWIISLYKSLGGERLTIGSDAHIPEHVGRNFEDTLLQLQRLGFNHYGYYKNRIYQRIDI